MSRGFVKDGDIEETPAVEQRAFLPEGVANYVTAEGLAALKREREELTAQREAASGNENDRRVTRNYLSAKLCLLDERIASAVLRERPDDPTVAGFGAYLTLQPESGEPRTVRIVGADEADAGKGLISFFSPVAKALYGHRAGDTIEAAGGRMTLTAVSYDPLPLTPLTPLATESRPAPARPAAPQKTVRKPVVQTHVPAIEKPTAKAPERQDNGEEVLPIVNDRGLTIGKATRRECHNGSKLLHPVVHLHLFNSRGELYLQQRPLWKTIQPGKWDTAVGGHIGFGEPASEALRREVSEELGINNFEPVAVRKYLFESDREREYVYLYKTVCDTEPEPGDELESGRFWSTEEIEENLGKGVFTPNFELEYSKYLK